MERTRRASRVGGMTLPGIPSSLPISGSAVVLGQHLSPLVLSLLFLSLQLGLHLNDCCQHPRTFQTLPSTAPSPNVPPHSQSRSNLQPSPLAWQPETPMGTTSPAGPLSPLPPRSHSRQVTQIPVQRNEALKSGMPCHLALFLAYRVLPNAAPPPTSCPSLPYQASPLLISLLTPKPKSTACCLWLGTYRSAPPSLPPPWVHSCHSQGGFPHQ